MLQNTEKPRKIRKPRMKGGNGLSIVHGSGTSVDNVNWRLIGASGNTSLEISLKKDQSIFADGGTMVYMDSALKVETRMSAKGSKGVFGAFGLAVGRSLSGENLFVNYYTGTDESKPQKVVLGIPLPGDFVMLNLQPGTGWKLSQGSFVACSTSVQVSGKANLTGFIGVGQDEGGFLTYVSSKDDVGSVWISAYGTIEKHELQDGEKIVVNNEHFLACPAEATYKLVRFGKSMKSLFFSGEGFAMQFAGPCTLYTQSKGVLRLVKELLQYMPSRN